MLIKSDSRIHTKAYNEWLLIVFGNNKIVKFFVRFFFYFLLWFKDWQDIYKLIFVFFANKGCILRVFIVQWYRNWKIFYFVRKIMSFLVIGTLLIYIVLGLKSMFQLLGARWYTLRVRKWLNYKMWLLTVRVWISLENVLLVLFYCDLVE